MVPLSSRGDQADESKLEKQKRKVNNGYVLGAVLGFSIFLIGVFIQDPSTMMFGFVALGIGIAASIYQAVMYVAALLEEQARGR